MRNKWSFNILMIVGYGGFEDGEEEILREQGVDLDDWNFMLFIEDPDDDVLVEDENGECEPYDYYLMKMVSDRCGDPVWKRQIKFRNKLWTLGVEYH